MNREKQIEEMANIIGRERCLRDSYEISKMIYNAGYRKQSEGEWFLLDECANEGVYCSVCHKKVYRKEYANQKVKSPFCPNCGAKMKGGEG